MRWSRTHCFIASNRAFSKSGGILGGYIHGVLSIINGVFWLRFYRRQWRPFAGRSPQGRMRRVLRELVFSWFLVLVIGDAWPQSDSQAIALWQILTQSGMG
jgi:hypothetical protein